MSPDKKYKLTILKNGVDEDHQFWVQACQKREREIVYTVIDLSKSNWFEKVLEEETDYFLAKAPATTRSSQQMYDERLYIIANVLNFPVYPSFEEVLIYENKRMLCYWLEANQIPHPKTWIFYTRGEALDFSEHCKFPVAAKTSIGASGSGIKILGNKKEILQYIEKAFSSKGITRKWGINWRKGDLGIRLLNRLKNLPGFIRYMHKKKVDATIEPQKWHVIFQEYIQSDFEWRCVRIGDSFFGHKKLARWGEMKSGTSKVSWDPPPVRLLDFVKAVTDKRNFLSQAVDIFEDSRGNYLVNELQAFWGAKNPHQMIIDGKPGRYILKEDQWIFEEGEFNTNNSYDLRLDHVIDILRNKIK